MDQITYIDFLSINNNSNNLDFLNKEINHTINNLFKEKKNFVNTTIIKSQKEERLAKNIKFKNMNKVVKLQILVRLK